MGFLWVMLDVRSSRLTLKSSGCYLLLFVVIVRAIFQVKYFLDHSEYFPRIILHKMNVISHYLATVSCTNQIFSFGREWIHIKNWNDVASAWFNIPVPVSHCQLSRNLWSENLFSLNGNSWNLNSSKKFDLIAKNPSLNDIFIVNRWKIDSIHMLNHAKLYISQFIQ